MMLSLSSSLTLLVGAVHAAKSAEAGIAGYAVASVATLLLGIFNFWALWLGGSTIARYLNVRPRPRLESWLNLLYLVLIAWMFIGRLIGEWVGSKAARIVASY